MFDQLNVELFNTINQFAGSSIVLDNLGVGIAKYLPFVFVLFLIYFWFRGSDYRHISLYCGFSAVTGILLNFLITLFYFHPRPFMNHIGHLLIWHVPETSFPSDHTTFVLSIAFTLLYFKKVKSWGVVLSILGIICGIARVYCGLHYPFDILGSVGVAIISSKIIFLFRKTLRRLNDKIISLYLEVLKSGG